MRCFLCLLQWFLRVFAVWNRYVTRIGMIRDILQQGPVKVPIS
jgi:hypothetical protein